MVGDEWLASSGGWQGLEILSLFNECAEAIRLDVNFWNPEGKTEIPDKLCLCDSFGGTISFFWQRLP
jgi:hypothetical protein